MEVFWITVNGSYTLMKQKIYIETSVISYFVARPSKKLVAAGHQVATQDMWNMLDEFDVYISDLVIQEASQGDKTQAALRLNALEQFQVLEIDDDGKKLAQILVKHKAVPDKCPEDALHIAIAAVNGIDVIVTWNFKHINNPFTKMAIRQVIENSGYLCPEICSPDEFLGDEL